MLDMPTSFIRRTLGAIGLSFALIAATFGAAQPADASERKEGLMCIAVESAGIGHFSRDLCLP